MNHGKIVWISEGGSLGSNSRVFLKGQKDGSFVKTDVWENITQELIFIEFEGKNYLLETTYDYNKKLKLPTPIRCVEP